MVEVITKYSIDDILENPAEYVDASEDLVLIKVNGVMIMLGTDDDDNFDDAAYFVLEDDCVSEYYPKKLYAETYQELFDIFLKELMEV